MNQHEGLAGGTRSRADVSFKTRPKKVGGFAVIILVNSGLQRRKSTRGVMHFPDQEKCSVCLDPPGPHIYYGARVRRGERGGRGEGSHQINILTIPLTRLVCPAEPSSRDL